MAAVSIKTHIVQPGETLWQIAEKHYGQGRFYLNVYLLNAVALANSGHKIDSKTIGPDFIYPGTELTIINGIDFQASGQ